MKLELPDDAKRFRDEYNTHRNADPYGSIGKWIAVRLGDGGTDHVLYDTKRDAVRSTGHSERNFSFVQLQPRTMSGHDAKVWLDVQRRLANAGMQMQDPDDKNGGREIIRRSTKEDEKNNIAAILGYGAPSNISFGG